MMDYIVKPAPHLIVTEQNMITAEPVRGLPSYGEIIKAPRGMPGQKGQRIDFQWNALLEADPVPGGYVAIPTELVYKANGVHLNNFVWCILHQRPTGFMQEDPNVYGAGEVVSCPRNTFIQPGDDIIFNPKLSHRVVAEEYDSRPIYALKLENILLYR